MAGEILPYIEWKAWKGLYTKLSSEIVPLESLTVAENVDFVQKYGAVSKLRGNRKILTDIYKEGGIAQKISWIGFHKASDVSGQILRHVLIAAGTTIRRIESDGSTTLLLSDRKKGKFHSSDRIDQFTYISNQNPDLIGDGNDPIKYDGSVTTQWGLTPPGSQETVIETFYSTHPWTAINCSISEENTITFDGDALQINKTGTTSRYFAIERSLNKGNTFYVLENGRAEVDSIANRVNCQVYIPRGVLTASNTSPNAGFAKSGPAVAVTTKSETSNAAWRFDFKVGELVEGWNQLNLDFTNGAPGSSSTAPAGDDILATAFDVASHAVENLKFEFYLQNKATTVSGIRLDRFVKLDEGAPIVDPIGASGELTGDYQYKVVFVSKYGNLSNAGPATVVSTGASSDAFYLTHIPISNDVQITGRRLYRTVANGSVFLFLDEINDNTTTDFEDRTPDGSLANETPPAAGDPSDDNSRPPKGGIVKQWKKTMFVAGDPANPEILAYSEDNEPESFPLINILEFDEKITAIYESYSGLVVETETGKWQVLGDNPDFSVDKIIKGMGCVGRRAAGTARQVGYAIDRDGMRLWDLTDVRKISEAIRTKYEDSTISKKNIELIHTVYSHVNNAIVQFNPNDSGRYSSIFMYQHIGDEVGTNTEPGFWSEIVTPSGANLNFLHAVEVEDRNGGFLIYAGGDDGMVYELFYVGAKNWIDANGTEYAMDSKFRTQYIRAGEAGEGALGETFGAIGRVTPSWVELRQVNPESSTWTATVDMAEGSDQSTARTSTDLSMQFGTNNSLIRQAVPQTGLIPSTYFRLQVRNNESNVGGTITAARIYFKVQEGGYQVITVESA